MTSSYAIPTGGRPDAVMAEGLAINYSGGSSMPDDVAAWLEQNQIGME